MTRVDRLWPASAAVDCHQVMHTHSSRSHCILLLILERREVNLMATKEEKDKGKDLIDSSICTFYMVRTLGGSHCDLRLRRLLAVLVAI